MLRIDHVVRAVRDLDEGSAWFAAHGITTIDRGVHPGWGTGNRVAPLGASYVELLAVLDRGVAEVTPLGRALLDRAG